MSSRESDRPPSTLLETLLADPAVQRRLAEVDSAAHTLTLDPGGAVEVGQPFAANISDKQRPATVQPFSETVSGQGAKHQDAVRIDRGFLARREISSPGAAPQPWADYRLIGQLGRGGTAVVYQAHQRAVDREVAIKVLRDDLADDPFAQQRFLTEARTIGGLDHPNVIALHELAINEAGQLFYSMKRVDGTSWNEVIGERTLEQNLRIFTRVADAIRYAHSRGLLHRDIKPENVMLGRFGEVLLADWGLSLPYPVPTTGRGQRSTMGGTPAYMAPEQAAGDLHAIGIHTDVYLMGGLLFHILTGFPPHFGETLIDCLRSAAKNEIRPSRVPGELIEIALQAMSTDPRQRFPSIEALQEAVQQYEYHQQSINLVDRARRHADQASEEEGYEKFSLALNLLGEATELWPDNRRAIKLLAEIRIEFARRASRIGDLDLAISLLEAAGEGQSELACRIRRQRRERSKQKQREARLSTLFTNSPDAVLLTELESGEIVECNDALIGLLGFEREEVIGKRIPDLDLWVSPERRSTFLETLQRRGRVENFEARFRGRDGRVVDTLISGRCVDLEAQQLLVTTLRDVTKRKEAEDALRRSRQRLREFTRLANLGTWELDVVSGKTLWSDETFRIAGLPKQSESPDMQEYFEMVHPDDRADIREAIRNAIEHGAAYELTIRHRRPDGSYNTVIARGQPRMDEEGNVTELYGTIQDITRQQADQEQAKLSASALQRLLDWTDKPLCVFDRSGTVIAASRPLCDRFDRATDCLRRGWTLEAKQTSLDALPENQRSALDVQFHFQHQPVGPPLRLSVESAPGSDSVFLAELEECIK